ncbi:unnamed protein product [Rodentolepis nana]|uniref:Uncharacterized protein n=1 Tax=Rodentolepis nana TaxID=102285 RepID=A0A3P7V9J4_RODNA|nr:unnamed protein product [Rodentolepis nana]
MNLTPDAQISKMGPPTGPYAVLQINFKSPSGKKTKVVPREDSDEVSFDLLNFVVSFGQPQEPLSDICDSAWSRRSSTSESTTPSPWGLTTAGASATSTGPCTKKVLNSTFSTQIAEVFKLVDPQQNNLVILQPSTIGLALNNIKSRWIDHARTLYNFQHCSKVSPSAEESTKKCFQLLAATAGITQDDEAVVIYFQKALSQQTLQNICHPNRTPSGISMAPSTRST